MSSWIEIKVCFDSAPEPLKVKQQLLNLLSLNDVENVVESYFDGVLSSDSPEDVREAIFTDEDQLPVVVYADTPQEAQRIRSLILNEFKGVLSPFLRNLDETDLGSAWSEGELFETDRFLICQAGRSPTRLALGMTEGRSPTRLARGMTNKFVIEVNPGDAFGNGQHVSTLAMLTSLEKLNLSPKQRVLDIGTGNGVLLIAASMLGVNSLLGTDLSQDILDEAQANFFLNHVKAETCLTSAVPIQRGLFDLVLVNIPVAGIRPLLRDMLAATTIDAQIIMSGFTASDGQSFAKELADLGLVFQSQEVVRGWAALHLKKQ